MAADQSGEVIARNLVDDARLTKQFASAVNVDQTVLAGGGISISLKAGQSNGYVVPWANESVPSGEVVCVLVCNPTPGLSPAGGASLTPGTGDSQPVWLRGSTGGYTYVAAIRTSTPKSMRLAAPSGGKPLIVLRSGIFSLDSWEQMQSRNLIYFDGGGMIYANSDDYTLPPASTVTLGGVIVGDGLSITPQGVLSATSKPLAPATRDTLGGIMVGQGLTATAAGLVSVRLGDGLEYDSTGALTAPATTPPDLSDYYTKTETDGRFYTKDLADATFQKKDTSGKEWLTQDAADRRYLQQTDAANKYLSKTDAQSTYLGQSAMPFRFKHIEASGTSDGNAMFNVAYSVPSGASGMPFVMVTDNYLQSDTLTALQWKVWSVTSGSVTIRAARMGGGGWANGNQPCKASLLLIWPL